MECTFSKIFFVKNVASEEVQNGGVCMLICNRLTLDCTVLYCLCCLLKNTRDTIYKKVARLCHFGG